MATGWPRWSRSWAPTTQSGSSRTRGCPPTTPRLVDAAKDRFGKLTGLVANAGIGVYGSILDHDDQLLRQMIETNYSGTVWAVRAAVPALLEGGGGDIVIVASAAGLRGGAEEAVYAGTKFAQVGLAGSLDRELREQGIRVCADLSGGRGDRVRDGHGPDAGHADARGLPRRR